MLALTIKQWYPQDKLKENVKPKFKYQSPFGNLSPNSQDIINATR